MNSLAIFATVVIVKEGLGTLTVTGTLCSFNAQQKIEVRGDTLDGGFDFFPLHAWDEENPGETH